MSRRTKLKMSGEYSGNGARAAVGLTRVVVPLWLLLGVGLALSSGNASHLPASLIKWVGPTGLDLLFVLYFGAAVELTVVGIAWFLPRLARTAEILLLLLFIPILVGDILLGAGSCGCFGAVQVSPWVTLSIDALLLLGLVVWGGRAPSLRLGPELDTWRVVCAGLWTLAVFALSFGLMAHRGGAAAAKTDGAVDGGMVDAATLPDYFLPEYEEWVGRQWAEVPIAAFVTGDLSGIEDGLHYILFYRKDCEHCHELMEVFFSDTLPGPTTAVAVPEKDGFPTEGLQPFNCDACSLAELPAGCDWFLQTPVLVRLQDGAVECAAEVSAADPQCIEW